MNRRRFLAAIGSLPAMGFIAPVYTVVIDTITPKLTNGITSVNGVATPYQAVTLEVTGSHFQVKKSQLNFEIEDQFGAAIKSYGLAACCYYATSAADGIQPFKIEMQARLPSNMVVDFPLGNWKMLVALHAPFGTVRANAIKAFNVTRP